MLKAYLLFMVCLALGIMSMLILTFPNQFGTEPSIKRTIWNALPPILGTIFVILFIIIIYITY